MGLPLRVLIADRREDHVLALLRTLKKDGYQPDHAVVISREALHSRLEEGHWDVLLVGDTGNAFTVGDLLEEIHTRNRDIPCILISDQERETQAAWYMSSGVQDFIRLDDLSRLAPAIARELREVSVREDSRRAQETLQRHAHFDALTNLPNRQLFADRLTLALAHAARERTMLAVVFIDLDRFKTIVDTLGHGVGDDILRQVADRLAARLPSEGTLARLGGDEFVALLPGMDRADKAAELAQSMLEALGPSFHSNGHELHVTTSIGISLYPYDGGDAETLLKNADTALYRAKEQGRNNYQLYMPAMNARSFERLALENSLRKALERQEFVLHYQPQVDTLTGEIVGLETLLRWQHPDLGTVYPSEFIGLAEETGLIVPLGAWALKNACAQARAWQTAGLPPVTIGVNLSARQFLDRQLIDTITQVLKETQLEPRWLELEITESTAMQNAEYSAVILKDLQQRGIRIAVDDFGTGYSSLSYLKAFPISTLKIDHSFVRDLSLNPDDAAIANAIIVLAHSLRLSVVAEGVETPAQARFLEARGCDRWQGYLFSRALPAAAFETFWRSKLPEARHNTHKS